MMSAKVVKRSFGNTGTRHPDPVRDLVGAGIAVDGLSGASTVAEVKVAVADAMGGCLFVDEAYMLEPDSSKEGRAILTQLLTVAEDRRTEISTSLAVAKDDSSALCEGDKIEADYRGRGRLYPGKISRACGEGKYDIAYDDGEEERDVVARLIRKLPLSPLAIAEEKAHAAVVALLEEHQK